MCPWLRRRLRMSLGVTDRRENGDPDSKSEHGALIGLPKTICMPRAARTLLVRNHTMMRSHSNLVALPSRQSVERGDFDEKRHPGCVGRDPSRSEALLSIEITKESPLHCPGCSAYEPEHLGDTPLRQVADYRGAKLVNGVLGLVRRYRPLHISIIAGEPLAAWLVLEGV
jgi:hypothetical protein